MTAGAQDGNSSQTAPSPASPPTETATPPGANEAPTTSPTITPGLTVTTPRDEPPLPKLPPDQFTECYWTNNIGGPGVIDWGGMGICEAQLARDKRIVIEKCINRNGKSPPPVVILAC